jgi:hypothetical protein
MSHASSKMPSNGYGFEIFIRHMRLIHKLLSHITPLDQVDVISHEQKKPSWNISQLLFTSMRHFCAV